MRGSITSQCSWTAKNISSSSSGLALHHNAVRQQRKFGKVSLSALAPQHKRGNRTSHSFPVLASAAFVDSVAPQKNDPYLPQESNKVLIKNTDANTAGALDASYFHSFVCVDLTIDNWQRE